MTTTIEGRQRYPVNIRYGRALPKDLNQLRRVLVETPTGKQVPLEQLADLRITAGPGQIEVRLPNWSATSMWILPAVTPAATSTMLTAVIRESSCLMASSGMERFFEGMQRATSA